jgi:hypothetical protein
VNSDARSGGDSRYPANADRRAGPQGYGGDVELARTVNVDISFVDISYK